MDDNPTRLPDDMVPDIPGLKENEKKAGSDNANKTGGGSSGEPKAAGNQELKSQENAAGLGSFMQRNGGGDFKFNPTDKMGVAGVAVKGLKAVGKYVGKHKETSLLAGGGITTAFLIGIAIAASLVTFAMKDVEKTITHVADAATNEMINVAQRHFMADALCRELAANPAAAAQANCTAKQNSNPEDNTDATPQAEQAQQQQADAADGGTSVVSEIDSFKFTDPAVMRYLEDHNITVKTSIAADGTVQLDGLFDTAGNPITVDQILSDPTVGGVMENALPAAKVGTVTTADAITEEQSGADFNGYTEQEDQNPEQTTEAEVLDTNIGSPGTADTFASNETVKPEPPSQNGKSQITPKQGGEVGASETMLTTAEQAIAQGDTESQVMQAVTDKLNSEYGGSEGDALLASAAASEVCGVLKVAQTASQARIVSILSLLTRHFSTLAAAADESTTSSGRAKTTRFFMNMLDGNPAAPTFISSPTKNNHLRKIANIAKMPWTKSAGYLIDTGQSSSINSDPTSANYNPPLAASSTPTLDSGTMVVNDVQAAVGDVGGQAVCAVEDSPFGFVANASANLADFVSSIGDFGLSTLLTAGLTTAAQQVVQHVLIPKIVAYFTPVALDGLEYGTQWFNNANAGGTIMFANYARSIGGQPMTPATANKTYTVAMNAQQKTYDATTSFSQRVFALSNPQSLVSRLAIDLPVSRLGYLSTMGNYLSSLPSMLMHTFSTIISPPSLLAANNNYSPAAADSITEYGLTNSQASQYHMISNEQFLTAPTLQYTNSSGTPVSVSRIKILGNPFQYLHGKQDPSQTDILHCYLQSYGSSYLGGSVNIASATNKDFQNPANMCGTAGNFDSNINPIPITNADVAKAYCDYFLNVTTQQGMSNPAYVNSCLPQMTVEAQSNNTIARYQQYLLDANVASDMTGLMSTGS